MSGYAPVPEIMANDVIHRRTMAKGINSLLQGKTNNTTTLTFTAGATSTTLTDARITQKSFIGLMPTTANAASALSTTYFSDTNRVNGSIVVSHANNSQTDRTFIVLIVG